MSLKKTQLKLKNLHHGKIFYCADLYTNDVAKVRLTSSLKHGRFTNTAYFEAVVQHEGGQPYNSEFYTWFASNPDEGLRRIFSKKKQAEEYLIFGATDSQQRFKVAQVLDASQDWWPDDEEYLVGWED